MPQVSKLFKRGGDNLGDDIAKIISRIDVDYSPAIKSAGEFATSLATLNKRLEKVKQTAATTAEQINRSFNKTGKQVTAESEKTLQAIPQQTQKMTQVTQQQLAKLEASLTSTAKKLQDFGIATPSVKGAVGGVRGLRDQLAAGKALNEEQMKYIANAQKIAAVEANNARIIDEQIKSKTVLKVKEEELVTSKQRAAVANQAYSNKELANARKLLPALEAQVASMQRSVEVSRLRSSPLTQQLTLMRRQLIDLRTKLSLENKITKEEAAQVMQLQRQASTIKQNIAMVKTDMLRQEDPTGKGGTEGHLEHRAGWFISGSMFYGSLSAMQQMVGVTSEVEMGLVQITRVMNDISVDTDDLRRRLIELGKTYGMVWSDVEHIATRWAQAGYDAEEVIRLTETSLLALNTAELDARYATEGLIAIMAQWQLTSEDLLPVIDKINKTADDFPITSQDLVDGLNRSSGAARVMGLTLEETIGILTTMREATGRTGKEVGNALNSILSFVQRPKAINVFEGLGIQVFADEARNEFRSVMEIFEDLASRWQDDSITEAAKNQLVDIADAAGLYTEEIAEAAGAMDEYEQATNAAAKAQGEFTDIEQRDAAQAAAGIYRRNYLVALLKNWSRVYDVLNAQAQSHGYSLQENEVTMATYEKQVQSLKTALVELATEVMNAGLLDVFKGIVNGATDMASAFSALPEPIQKLIGIFGALTVAVAALQFTTRVLFGVGILGGIKSLARLTAGLTVAETAALGLGGALRAIALSPAGIAIITITTLVTGLTIAFSNAKKEAKELAKVPEEMQNLENTEKLAEQYETLSRKINRTEEETARLVSIKRQLSDQFPAIIESMDEQGNVTEINNDILRESIELQREEIDIKRDKLALAFEEGKAGKDLESKQRELDDANKQVLYAMEQIEETEKRLSSFEEGLPGEGVLGHWFDKKALKRANDDFLNLRERTVELKQELKPLIRNFDSQAAAALSTSEAFKNLDNSIGRGLAASLRKLNDDDISKVRNQILALGDSKETATAIDELQLALDDLNKTGADTESVDAFNTAFQNLISTLMDGEVSLGLTSDAAGTLAYALLDTIDPTTSAQIKLHHLNQTMNDLREGTITATDAASRAYAIMGTNISATTMSIIASIKTEIRTLADLAEAHDKARQAAFLSVTQGGIASGMGGTSWKLAQINREMGAFYGVAGQIMAIANRSRGVGGGGGVRSTGSPSSGSSSSRSPSSGSSSSRSPSLGSTAKAAEKAVTWLDKFKDSLESAIPASVLYRFNQLDKAISSLDWSTPNRQLIVLGRELEYLQTKANSTALSAGEFARAEELIAEKTKLLQEQIAMTAPFMSDINQNIHEQISYLNDELARAQERYAKARNDKERREALEAIKLVQDALEELWALYDRSNQMAWDSHIEMLGLLRVKLDMFNSSLRAAVPPDVLLRFHELDRTITSLDWSTPTRQLTVLNRELGFLQTKMSLCVPIAGDLARTQELIADKAKLLYEQTAMVAPYMSDINQNIHKQIGILQDELKDAYAWYAAAETEDEKRIALEAIKTTTDAIDELWAMYDRSNQMAWDNHTEMIEMAAMYAEYVFDEYKRAAQKEIRAIQQELDEMDSEDALKKHNERLEELQEERRYHELRTGKEHAKAIKEIDKQIQDEQESWARDQEKQELQDRIDFLEEQQRLIDEQLIQGLATLATYDDKWYDTFKTWADEAVEGWRAGDVGNVITGELANIVKTLTDQYGVPIDIPEYKVPEAHTGAKVGSTGLAMLLEGERVLSPELTVSFDRLSAALLKTPSSIGVSGGVERKLDKLLTILETKSGIQINGNLVNMENVDFEDRADIQIFNRGLARQLRSLGMAKG
jgi:TP901 family phage tail tape measure protein